MIHYLRTKIIGLWYGVSTDPKCIRFFHCEGCYINRPKTCENSKCLLCDKRREYKRKKPIAAITKSNNDKTNGD